MSVGLAHIRRALQGHQPSPAPRGLGGRAAVAVVVCPDPPPRDGARLLFIERASKDGDPWSGDLAFPGGRVEPGDADERAAAERETLEEVGLDLSAAERLGRLDDLAAQVLPITVSAFAYAVERPAPLRTSEEVRDAFWVALDDLFDPGRRRLHVLRRPGHGERRFPAVDLLGPDRPLLWGVTYRFVCGLGGLVGVELPALAD